MMATKVKSTPTGKAGENSGENPNPTTLSHLKTPKTDTVSVLGGEIQMRPPVGAFELTAAERGLAEYLEVDLTADIEVLAARAKEDFGRLLLIEIRAGLRLIAIKGRITHGEFADVLADAGIPNRGAQKTMQTARAFASIGDARRREQILAMGKTKGVALLAAKPDVRELILNDPDLSQEAMEASKLELYSLLKEKDTQIERHQKAYANLEERMEGKELELRKLSKVSPVALLTRSMRAEAVACAAAIGECCDNLARLLEAAGTEPAADGERYMRRRTVALAVSAGMAHLQAIRDAVTDDLGEVLPLTPGVMDDLTQEERRLAEECLERVRMQFLLRLEQRRDETYAEHLSDGGKKKRGRPPVKMQGRQ